MKKKLLFVIPSLDAGGAEKSLVNLLNEFDFEKYEVHLFMMTRRGVFISQLPAKVKILPESPDYQTFSSKFHKSIFTFFLQGKLKLVWNKLLFTFYNRTIKNNVLAEQKNWRYIKHFFNSFPEEYDVAIGYLEKTANNIVADCVCAEIKIGYIHTDYKTMGMFGNYDISTFKKLDYIATVSENCLTTLKDIFPIFASKFKVIENISSPGNIFRLANEKVFERFNKPTIVSVGRLTELKNFGMAIKVSAILREKGYDFEWTIIGEGEQRETLQNSIKEKKLQGVVKLVGLKENPYPYIAKSFIYVQPSKFEGKSIAIDEAKILLKPIVVTNFPTVYDQIKHEETGLICAMNETDLANAIERLFTDEELRIHFTENLKREKWNSEIQLCKFYELMEN